MKIKTYQLDSDDSMKDSNRFMVIYSDEEDYRLAFLLNYHLQTHFVKVPSLIQKKSFIEFSIFEYNDTTHYRDWFLLCNYQLVKQDKVQLKGLFSDIATTIEIPAYYLKELYKARFILKIIADEPNSFYENLLNKLKEIPQIYAAEFINLQSIKEKELLNF